MHVCAVKHRAHFLEMGVCQRVLVSPRAEIGVEALWMPLIGLEQDQGQVGV